MHDCIFYDQTPFSDNFRFPTSNFTDLCVNAGNKADTAVASV